MTKKDPLVLEEGDRHDSVIYSRSERPAVVYICRSERASKSRPTISERMGDHARTVSPPRRSKCVGLVSRFKCTGQWFPFSTWVGVHIYLDVRRMSPQIDQIVQLSIRSKRLGQPHVKTCGLSATFQAHGPMGLILVYGRYPASSGPGRAYLYWCSDQMDKNSNCRHTSPMDSLTLTRSVFTGIMNVVMKNVICCPWHFAITGIVIVAPKVDPDIFSDWIVQLFA